MKNKIIQCKCGCGKNISLLDKWGRKRGFISGHNGRKYKNKTQHKREWNYRNRRYRYIYKTRYLHKKKAQLITIKGSRCEKCQVKYNGTNACIFDFHHKNPKHIYKQFTMTYKEALKRSRKK